MGGTSTHSGASLVGGRTGVDSGGSPAGGTTSSLSSSTGGAAVTGGSFSTVRAPEGGTSSGGTWGTGGTQTMTTTGGAAITTGGTRATTSASTAGGAAATGGATAATGGSTAACVIRTYDAAHPPAVLKLSGNLATHDPSVIFANGTYYQFATGNGIGCKTSSDLTNWVACPDVFATIPSWVAGKLSGVTNIWAPDISFFNGEYHLYYSVSTFGSNKSCIGHATRSSLSSGAWSDHGAVICSNVGTSDKWNAIDPNVIIDDAGTPWLSFGSFWNGIMMIKLDPTGARADSAAPTNIAHSSSIEGPYIIHQCGYYYLFVSFGSCCTSPWDYNLRVGRSRSVTGPYVDRAGTDMLNGGGTRIVAGNSTWTAPGHNAILLTATGAYNIYHSLDPNHENPTLRVAELVLDADGWPVSGGP